MPESRQQIRHKNKRKQKDIKKQKQELNQPVTTQTFIQYAVQMESNLTILTNFIKEQFPTEFTAYIERLQAEAERIEKGPTDAEVVSEEVLTKREEKS